MPATLAIDGTLGGVLGIQPGADPLTLVERAQVAVSDTKLEALTAWAPGVAALARRLGHDLLLLHFYDGDALCTKICADRTARRLVIQNETDDILATAFGVNTAPDWSDFEDFLTSHCVSKDRDGIREYLSALGIDGYEPLNIIRKTGGRMAEDHQWIKILEG